jgi:NadR type nicotinamide-nucleotide adenylyltransferase
MTVGLTLGKYAPLHKGHQLVIEKALSETDHVIVIIYDAPETTSCPLTVRANWIRQLYPTVEIIEAWDGPTIVGDTPEIKQTNEDYILKVLAGRRITHFYSSEFYGEHVSSALGAIDRRIDPERLIVPVSGTLIRQHLYENRRYLDPLVYSALITKVVFLGAPSTGKTSLTEKLAEEYATVFVPEYGREYWERNQVERRLSLEQLVEIALGHKNIEENMVCDANKYMFIDTDATTTYMFSLYYHGTAHQHLTEMSNETLNRYDLFFLCEDDIPYSDTWDRSGKANRTIFQKQVRADLLRRRIPYISVRGTFSDRMSFIKTVLNDFNKYDSIGNNLMKRKKNAEHANQPDWQ